jgi:hypothetical protein
MAEKRKPTRSRKNCICRVCKKLIPGESKYWLGNGVGYHRRCIPRHMLGWWFDTKETK